MASLKSLIIRAEIDEAVHAHNCQRSNFHRILRGEKRLKVRNGRGWDHYCMECARQILQKDQEKLRELANRVNES